MLKKKILSCVLAACSVVACAGTLTACETNRPEVEMKIVFNGETYTLDYTLYRQIAPNTVEHFLWLANGHFYDNTVIHNYSPSTSRLYGGLYGYLAEEDRETESVYYDVDTSYKAFCEKYKDSFPASVFTDSQGKTPTYTLYGEFSGNKFGVENGSLLKETFGSLTMYYNTKTTDDVVYIKRVDSKNSYSSRSYNENSATTMFYISTTASSKTNSNYCTFATLSDDSVSVLKDLQSAISDYITDKYNSDSEDFVTNSTMYIDKEDTYVGDQDKTAVFAIPNEPIIIKSVKVKKY